MKVKMHIENKGDIKLGQVKINAISSSSVVIFGDAETLRPRNVSITRGVRTPVTIPSLGPGGPVGSIR
jgi:hypothetical protein